MYRKSARSGIFSEGSPGRDPRLVTKTGALEGKTALHALLHALCRAECGAAVLLELVVQRLEADAQDLCGTGLIVARGFEGLEDEEALRLVHGGADLNLDGVGVGCVVRAGTHDPLAEARRQMARFELTLPA